MAALLSLESIAAADAARVGGKAFGCARLLHAGAPVPDGIVVPGDAAWSAGADAALHAWLRRLPDGARFAVRSSAAEEDGAGQSFAGIYETRLNVAPADIPAAIAACRASRRAARARAYRGAHALADDAADMAILVQAMIEPRIAGVAFTCNPITGVCDEIVVNSCWGLGEALVSGQIDPDEFRVRKVDGAVLASHIGDKRYRAVAADGVCRLVATADAERRAPSLRAAQLRELVALLTRVERAFGAPQDVEWAHDGAQFWLLQSRPVTASAAPGADIEWTRANAREVLPDVTSPQALALFSSHLEHAFRAFAGRLVAPEAVLGPMTKAFYGRLYLNLSQLRYMARMLMTPAAVLLRGFGHSGEITAEDERALRPSLRELLAALPDLVRVGTSGATAGRAMRALFAAAAAVASQLDDRDPAGLPDAEILAGLDLVTATLADQLGSALKLGGATSYEGALTAICRRIGCSSTELLQTHLAVGEPSVSTQQAFDLLLLVAQARREPAAARNLASPGGSLADYRAALAGTEFLVQLDRFLARYGHRGVYETDWALPRFREDPTPLLDAVRTHLRAAEPSASPAELMAQRQRAAADAWSGFAGRARGVRRPLRPLVRWLLGRAKAFGLWRERGRFEMMRVLSAVRRWHLALADRWVVRGWIEMRDDYFLLTLAEVRRAIVDPAASPELADLARRRRSEQEAWRRMDMPLLLRERELPTLLHRARHLELHADGSRLEGMCVSGGCVEAEVAVIADPTDFAHMKRGAILVAAATAPSWTPLFTLAAGVIVEIGGTLSHASTVAREYGLPALANVRNVTRILRSGDRVRLDATRGTVEVLSRSDP